MIERDDTLALNAKQLETVASSILLRPLDVDPRIADRAVDAGPDREAGHVRVQCFEADKLSRLTAYRFHRADVLNEHLFHAWPARGYDLPALTTVIFEMQGVVVVGADLLPIADVVLDTSYYDRWMVGYAELLAEHWSHLVAHRAGPEPAPDAYFTNQIGSTLSVLLYLRPTAIGPATEFVLALTRLWTTLYASAEPRTEARAMAVERRRVQLMTRTYKGLDYQSPASDGLASVLGWEGANLMFDAVFGPDVHPQPLGVRRTYVETDLKPGVARL